MTFSLSQLLFTSLLFASLFPFQLSPCLLGFLHRRFPFFHCLSPTWASPFLSTIKQNSFFLSMARMKALWKAFPFYRQKEMRSKYFHQAVKRRLWLSMDSGRAWTAVECGPWSSVGRDRVWAVVQRGLWSSVGRGRAWTVVELGLRKYVFINKSVSDLSHRTAKRQQFNGQNHFCLVKFFHRLLTYIFFHFF